MALCATSSYYDSTEIAARILPNVVVLTIDSDSDVRSKAFQAIDQFLQILKHHHEKTDGGESAGASSLGISSIPGNASILGWAMSSLTLKGKPSEQTPLAPAKSSAPLTTAASNASSVIDTASTTTVGLSLGADLADQADGWGELENGIDDGNESEKEGWDDIEPVEGPRSSQALSTIQAAPKRPVSQPKQVLNLKPKIVANVHKDEDDKLWGSIAAPAPKTVKPLTGKTTVAADDDGPWAAIAAPPLTTRARPLASGRGRGSKPVVSKLGAQRINRTSSSGV